MASKHQKEIWQAATRVQILPIAEKQVQEWIQDPTYSVFLHEQAVAAAEATGSSLTLAERFFAICNYALLLLSNNDANGAKAQFARARELGVHSDLLDSINLASIALQRQRGIKICTHITARNGHKTTTTNLLLRLAMGKTSNAFDDFDSEDVFHGVDEHENSFASPPPPPPPFDEDSEDEQTKPAVSNNRLSKRIAPPPFESFAPKRAPSTQPPAPPPPPPGPPPPEYSDEEEGDDFFAPPPPGPPPPEYSDEEGDEDFAPPPPNVPPPPPEYSDEDESDGFSPPPPPPPPLEFDESDDEADYGIPRSNVAQQGVVPPPPMSDSEESEDELNTSGRSHPPPPPPVTVTSDEESDEDYTQQQQQQHQQRPPSMSISSSDEDDEYDNMVQPPAMPPPPPEESEEEGAPKPPPESPVDSEDEHVPSIFVARPPPPPPSDSEDEEQQPPLPPVFSESEEEDEQQAPPPPPFVESEEEQQPPVFVESEEEQQPPVFVESEEEQQPPAFVESEDEQQAPPPPPVFVESEEEEEEEQQAPPPVAPPPVVSEDEESVDGDTTLPLAPVILAAPPPPVEKEMFPDSPLALEKEELAAESAPKIIVTPEEKEEELPRPPSRASFEQSFVPIATTAAAPVQVEEPLSPILAPVAPPPAAHSQQPLPQRRGSTSHVPSSFFDPSSSEEEEEEIFPPSFPPPREVLVEQDYTGGKSTAITLSRQPINAPERTLAQYAVWIDSLRIWPTILDLGEAIKSGVLLHRLLERLRPATPLPPLPHANPKTKQACLDNLEISLDFVWKQRVSASNMPRSAEDLFSANNSAVVRKLMLEVFQVFALPSATQKMELFDWLEGVLRHYDYVLPDSLSLPPHRGAFDVFRTGDALLCVLHFFCGPEGNRELGLPAVDLNRVCREFDAGNAKQIVNNVRELFDVLESMDPPLPVPWTAEDFLLAQDGDMLLVQLHAIHTLFKARPCALPLVVPGGALPPAGARAQYVMVGSHGEVKVMGVSFLLGENFAREEQAGAAPAAVSQPLPSSVFEPLPNEEGEIALQLLPSGVSRSFSGFHSFSSHDVDEQFQSGFASTEREISGEVFFLKGAFHAPLAMSDVMAQSVTVSMDRALATSYHAPPLSSSQAHELVRSSSSNNKPSLITQQSVRDKMHQRLAGTGNPILLLPSFHNAAEDEKRANRERRAMQVEDERRREFLRRQALGVQHNARRRIGAREEGHGNELDKVQVAFDWLQIQREVRFHNRNKRVATCRMSVSLTNSGYRLDWYDVKQPSAVGQVYFSALDSIQTSGEEEDSFYLYIHLKPIIANGRRAAAGGVLKVEPPPNRQHDALRMFTNLNILLEDCRNSGRASAAQHHQQQRRGDEF